MISGEEYSSSESYPNEEFVIAEAKKIVGAALVRARVASFAANVAIGVAGTVGLYCIYENLRSAIDNMPH